MAEHIWCARNPPRCRCRHMHTDETHRPQRQPPEHRRRGMRHHCRSTRVTSHRDHVRPMLLFRPQRCMLGGIHEPPATNRTEHDLLHADRDAPIRPSVSEKIRPRSDELGEGRRGRRHPSWFRGHQPSTPSPPPEPHIRAFLRVVQERCPVHPHLPTLPSAREAAECTGSSRGNAVHSATSRALEGRRKGRDGRGEGGEGAGGAGRTEREGGGGNAGGVGGKVGSAGGVRVEG